MQCQCKSLCKWLIGDIACWRRRFNDGSLLPFAQQVIFFLKVGVSVVRIHRVQNVEQYSDHGQSVISSFLEYCNDKNVSTSNSDQHGIATNGRNATTPGRPQYSNYFPAFSKVAIAAIMALIRRLNYRHLLSGVRGFCRV